MNKTIGTISFIILLLLAAWYIYGKFKPSPVISSPVKFDSVKYLRDENGKLYSKLQQYIITLDNAQGTIDSLGIALNIKPKYIKGVDRTIETIDTVFSKLPAEIVIKNGDTVYRVEKHDPWIDAIATVGKDSGSMSFSLTDTTTRVIVQETPLIGRGRSWVYLGHTNPYIETKEGYSFEIKDKEPWLVFGPSISYNPFSASKVTIGISATIPLIKLKR